MPGKADASVTGSADPVVAFSDSVDGAAGPVGEPNLQEPAGHARAGSRAKTAADSLQLPSTSTAPALLSYEPKRSDGGAEREKHTIDREERALRRAKEREIFLANHEAEKALKAKKKVPVATDNSKIEPERQVEVESDGSRTVQSRRPWTQGGAEKTPTLPTDSRDLTESQDSGGEVELPGLDSAATLAASVAVDQQISTRKLIRGTSRTREAFMDALPLGGAAPDSVGSGSRLRTASREAVRLGAVVGSAVATSAVRVAGSLASAAWTASVDSFTASDRASRSSPEAKQVRPMMSPARSRRSSFTSDFEEYSSPSGVVGSPSSIEDSDAARTAGRDASGVEDVRSSELASHEGKHRGQPAKTFRMDTPKPAPSYPPSPPLPPVAGLAQTINEGDVVPSAAQAAAQALAAALAQPATVPAHIDPDDEFPTWDFSLPEGAPGGPPIGSTGGIADGEGTSAAQAPPSGVGDGFVPVVGAPADPVSVQVPVAPVAGAPAGPVNVTTPAAPTPGAAANSVNGTGPGNGAAPVAGALAGPVNVPTPAAPVTGGGTGSVGGSASMPGSDFMTMVLMNMQQMQAQQAQALEAARQQAQAAQQLAEEERRANAQHVAQLIQMFEAFSTRSGSSSRASSRSRSGRRVGRLDGREFVEHHVPTDYSEHTVSEGESTMGDSEEEPEEKKEERGDDASEEPKVKKERADDDGTDKEKKSTKRSSSADQKKKNSAGKGMSSGGGGPPPPPSSSSSSDESGSGDSDDSDDSDNKGKPSPVGPSVREEMKDELSSAKAPKARQTDLTELPRRLANVSKMSLKEGIREMREFENFNGDVFRSFAPEQKSGFVWWRYVRKVAFKILLQRRALTDPLERDLYRPDSEDYEMPNKVLQQIEESKLGGAVRRALPAHAENSPLRLWKRKAVNFFNGDATVEVDSTVTLLVFSLAPLFDKNDGQITELFERTSWCNPPDTIGGISQRLELFQEDLDLRADLWPAEKYPPIMDFRVVLVNMRKVLHKSQETAVVRVHKQVMKREIKKSIERCENPTVLYAHLEFLIKATAGLKSVKEKCAVEPTMKKTRIAGTINATKAATDAGGGRKRRTRGKRATEEKEESAPNGGSVAAAKKSFEELATINQRVSQIACPAFETGQCCPMCDFCPLMHGEEQTDGTRKVGNGERRCVCGQPLTLCKPANHRRVERPEGKKYTVWRRGEKHERAFIYGGLKSQEMRRGLTDPQKKQIEARDKLLVKHDACHALPPYHPKSPRHKSKGAGTPSTEPAKPATGDDEDEKKRKLKEKKALKKAELAELVELGREAKKAGAAKAGRGVAEAEPKAAPTSRDRAFISEAHRQAEEGKGGALKDASGHAKAGTGSFDEPTMLSDSGCFRFAAPLGATKAEPNRSAKVQPIDGDPLTVPSVESGGEQVLLLGDELVCSENRAVQRKHKNGTRFIVHRANSGTQYAEVDERGEERIRRVIAEEAARSGGKLIQLTRKNGCDYVEGDDVAYVWNASSLPRLKKGAQGAPVKEPDERAGFHATGIAQRARNPNMHERYEHWGRFALLFLMLKTSHADLAKEASSAIYDLMDGRGAAACVASDEDPALITVFREGDPGHAPPAHSPPRARTRLRKPGGRQVIAADVTPALEQALCCCCQRSKHLMIRCERVTCTHTMCGSCWSNQGGTCPDSHHTGEASSHHGLVKRDIQSPLARSLGVEEERGHHGRPPSVEEETNRTRSEEEATLRFDFDTRCTPSTEIQGTSLSVEEETTGCAPLCSMCCAREVGSDTERLCRGCEEKLLDTIGISVVTEGLMAVAGDLFGTERAQWTRRWINASSHQRPLTTRISREVLGVGDDNFDYVYKARIDVERLDAMMKRLNPYQVEMRMLWNRCQKETSCLFDTVKMFEAILSLSTDAQVEEDGEVTWAGIADAKKAAKPKAVDHCIIHGVYDSSCEICRQVFQRLLVKYRGTSSLLRGRWLGAIVIYLDLKDGLPRSERGNLYLMIATVYIEATWDARTETWKYVHKLSIDIAMRRKDERNVCYAIKVILTEARITRSDRWYIHSDNEPAVCGQAALGMIVTHGGDIVNSIPRLHDGTAEAGVRLSLRRGSHGVRMSNLGPMCWDDVHETTSLWESEERGIPGWKRFYNDVPKFRLGAACSVKLPEGTPGRQEYPVGGQDAVLRGIVRRTARGVRIFYRDANEIDRLRSTVVAIDMCIIKDELGFAEGQTPGALKEPWPELKDVDAMMDRDERTKQPYFVPCLSCGIYRSTTRATYCDWDEGKLEERCESYLKNQVLPEFWSCWEPTEDFVGEQLDWRQPTAESKAAEKSDFVDGRKVSELSDGRQLPGSECKSI